MRLAILVALAVLAMLGVTGCSTVTRLDWTSIFTRQGWQRTDEVIRALELRPGDHVADIGSGDGYFSFALADAVGPDGRVYAVDVDPDAVRAVSERARERGYANVVAVLARPEDPLLPDATIDVAFLCNAYHHIDGRVPYFERLRADLEPGGRVAVIDIKEGFFPELVTPKGHGTPVPLLLEEMAAARYRHVASHDFLPLQSFEIFAPNAE